MRTILLRRPRLLVACEESGTVRDAFIAQGVDAMSCDLLPSRKPGPHYRGDVRDIINDGWHGMIAHPPCTFLSSSGMHWTTRGLRDPQLTEDALTFVSLLLEADIPLVGLENPVGVISTRIRKPEQIIQPWMFGHDASKTTCLWLKGFPPLRHTQIVPPEGYVLTTGDAGEHVHRNGYRFRATTDPARKPVWSNQTPSGQNKLGPGEFRARDRSVTYDGIAQAMATQWTPILRGKL